MSETMEKLAEMEQPTVEETPGALLTVEQAPSDGTTAANEETTWVEEIEIAGSQLVERVKELITEGNVRRLILRTQDDKLILEIPLTAGAVFGGVVTLFAPLVAALGALAALIARIKVQIVRAEDKGE
jgi:hypothetical protein